MCRRFDPGSDHLQARNSERVMGFLFLRYKQKRWASHDRTRVYLVRRSACGALWIAGLFFSAGPSRIDRPPFAM